MLVRCICSITFLSILCVSQAQEKKDVDLMKDPAGMTALAEVQEFLKKLAQGNAAEVNVKSAAMDKAGGGVHIAYSLRHRHRPLKDVVLYDHTTDGEINYNLDTKGGTIKVGALKLDIQEFGKVKLQDVLDFLSKAIGVELGPLTKLVGDVKIPIKVDEFEKFKKALESFEQVRKSE